MPDIKDKGSLKIVTYIPDDEVATLAERQKFDFKLKISREYLQYSMVRLLV